MIKTLLNNVAKCEFNECSEDLGTANFRLFVNLFERDSIDGKSMKLVLSQQYYYHSILCLERAIEKANAGEDLIVLRVTRSPKSAYVDVMEKTKLIQVEMKRG